MPVEHGLFLQKNFFKWRFFCCVLTFGIKCAKIKFRNSREAVNWKKKEIKILSIAMMIALTVFIAIIVLLLRCRLNSAEFVNTALFMSVIPASTGIFSYFGLEHRMLTK